MKIKDLFYSNKCSDYLEDIEFFSSSNRKGIGITISPSGLLLLKIYLEIKESDNLSKYNLVLDNDFSKFKKFKKYADFSLSSSYAIGRKISNLGDTYNYYHVKFKENFNFNNYYYKLSLLDIKNCRKGYSKEYSKDVIYRKKYFYFYSSEQKRQINSLFNLNLDIETVDHFEIYSKNRSNVKLNYIFKSNLFDIEKLNLDKQALYILEETNDLFEKQPVYAGKTNTEDISIYYSFTK